jgi:uncharacterized HAD superfamily protein
MSLYGAAGDSEGMVDPNLDTYLVRNRRFNSQQFRLFMQVYIDLDDVLSQSALGYIKVFREHFGRTVRFEDIHSFDLSKSFGLTALEHRRFLELIHDPAVLMEFAPMPGAREVLERWSAAGVVISVVTGRPSTAFDVTRAWLTANAMPFNSLLFVRKYPQNPLDPHAHPTASLRSLLRVPFNLAIEDNAKVATFLIRHLGIPVFLLERPWNPAKRALSPETRSLLVRCRSWLDIDSIFQTLPQP